MYQALMLILTSIALSVVGQFVLKKGATALGPIGGAHVLSSAIAVATNPYIVGGLACYGLGAVTWIMVLSRVPLSFAYPMLALNQVLILLVAWLFLGETVGAMRWAGVALIIGGVFLVSRS